MKAKGYEQVCSYRKKVVEKAAPNKSLKRTRDGVFFYIEVSYAPPNSVVMFLMGINEMLLQTISQLRFVRPAARRNNIKIALVFDLFSFWYRCKGIRLTSPFERKLLPSGTYIIARTIPRIGINMFGREYCFTEEFPLEYVPYSPEAAQEISQKVSQPLRIVKITFEVKLNNPG